MLERVVQETKSLGFQKEKYDDFICDLRWTKTQLRQFISDRIDLLAKRQYKGEALAMGIYSIAQLIGGMRLTTSSNGLSIDRAMCSPSLTSA